MTTVTPLPRKPVLAVLLLQFSNAVILTSPFAYLPFMIRDFVTDDDSQVGYYVGMVASSYFLGRVIMSYWWGRAADVWGRRPLVLLSVLLMSVLMLMFGFSQSLPYAVTTRFLTGMSSGLISISTTTLGEICDNSNQALGMTIMITAWGLGLILGPALGGTLTDPGVVPAWRKSSYPYLLPCLVFAVCSLFSFVVAFFFYPETLHIKKAKQLVEEAYRSTETIEMDLYKDPVTDETTINNNVDDHSDQYREDHIRKHGGQQYMSLPTNDVVEDDVDGVATSRFEDISLREETTQRTETTATETEVHGDTGASHKKSVLMFLLSNRVNLAVLGVYSFFNFASTGMDELYPLFLSTSFEHGGVSWTQASIGESLAISGVLLVIVQVSVYPFLERRWGCLKIFRVFSMLTVVATFLIPPLHFLQRTISLPKISVTTTAAPFLLSNHSTSNDIHFSSPIFSVNTTAMPMRELSTPLHPISVEKIENPALLWTGVLIVNSLYRVLTGTCFVSMNLFINNSVPTDLRGSMNGLSFTVASILRTLAPTVTGSLYAWSLSNHRPFLFSTAVAFLLLAVSFLVGHLMSYLLPLRINKQFSS